MDLLERLLVGGRTLRCPFVLLAVRFAPLAPLCRAGEEVLQRLVRDRLGERVLMCVDRSFRVRYPCRVLAEIDEVTSAVVGRLEHGARFVPVVLVLAVEDLSIALPVLSERAVHEAAHTGHGFVLWPEAASQQCRCAAFANVWEHDEAIAQEFALVQLVVQVLQRLDVFEALNGGVLCVAIGRGRDAQRLNDLRQEIDGKIGIQYKERPGMARRA